MVRYIESSENLIISPKDTYCVRWVILQALMGPGGILQALTGPGGDTASFNMFRLY